MRSTRLGCVAALAAVTGCRSTVQRPLAEYMRALPPGASALRLVTDPRRLPDIAGALRGADESLRAAVDESILWYSAPSSRQHFPCCAITHAEAQASLVAMRDLLSRDMPAESLEAEVRRLFDVYESVGYDGSGVVLFTGYFSPIFPASPTRTERFGHPLYRRPADLVTDPVTAAPLGRRMPDGSIAPWPTRREIESSGMLAGTELVWLEDPLSAYIVHVNGSARLRIEGPDGGRDMYVGYAGKTDRPYTGLGRLMVDEGLIRPEELSLAAIRRVYERDPQRVLRLIERNQSYVFFTEYDGDRWPQGSLGVRVTPLRSLATDKKIYPRGALVLVDTKAVSVGGRKRDFLQLMLDQDAGGAIQAPGRADLYMGVGPEAEVLAGGQYAEGRLYYFFLKPWLVDEYARR